MAQPRSIEMPMMRTSGLLRFQRQRDARYQAATGQLHQRRIDIRHLFQHFQPERPLAGDDMFGCSKGGIIVKPSSVTRRLASTSASSWDLPTIRVSAPSARIPSSLLLRHQFRHADDAGHPGLAGRPGEGPAVVPGRHRGDAGRCTGSSCRTEFIAPRQLERPRGLQVLVRQQNLSCRIVADSEADAAYAQGSRMWGAIYARAPPGCRRG